MSFPKNEIEALWSPWRVEYYHNEHSSGQNFLLEAATSPDDAAHLIIRRTPFCFLLMNKYPYSCGHLMAAPNRPVAEMHELSRDEAWHLWALAVHAQALLRKVVRAQGFNVGLNLGEHAGAGLAAHLHLHIVPRWKGDHNFMPVIGHTRILPQALQPLYEKLRQADRELPDPLSQSPTP